METNDILALLTALYIEMERRAAQTQVKHPLDADINKLLRVYAEEDYEAIAVSALERARYHLELAQEAIELENIK